MSTLVWREARQKAGFKGTLDSLLDTLGNIRLATVIEQKKGRGRPKAAYQIEVMSDEEKGLLDVLDIIDFHVSRPHFRGVGVYN